MVSVELESTLKRALREGINLFFGSGFSVLATDVRGRPLPTGGTLAEELRMRFSLPDSLTLPQVCTILEAERRDDLHVYMRERFTVARFSPKYRILDQCAIKSVFTTNVDDLVRRVFQSSARYYVQDVTLRGVAHGDKAALKYVPLHGSVSDDSRPLVFSSAAIANAFSLDQPTWHHLRASVLERETLFWGYSFGDAGVFESLFRNGPPATNAMWVVLQNPDEAASRYFRALGLSIIEAETEELLDYLAGLDLLPEPQGKAVQSTRDLFPLEAIPQFSDSLYVRPLIDFYLGEPPTWYDILAGRIQHTSHYHKTINEIDSGADILVLGAPACGKTTLMMQVAASYGFSGHKMVTGPISPEKAVSVLNKLAGARALVFIDNFADDVDGLRTLAEAGNVQVVGFERDHNYEMASHRLESQSFQLYDATELTAADTRLLYDQIPPEVRQPVLIASQRRPDEPAMSLFEFVDLNMKGPRIRDRYISVLQELERNSTDLAELFIMSCYVHACRSPLSFDMVYAFLSDSVTDHRQVYERIAKLGSLVRNVTLRAEGDVYAEVLDGLQDYYSPRSTIISETVLSISPPTMLRVALKRFWRNVSPYRISRYDVFRRKAFDADIMRRAFPEWKEGKLFYEELHGRAGSAYVLQQGALYLASRRQYKDAFAWIDKALLATQGRVFSIRNSHAVILFSANIASADEQARRSLDRSMQILEGCYNSDRRKLYHALVFADQAVKYAKKFGDAVALRYLRTAQRWLELEARRAPWRREVGRMTREVQAQTGVLAP